MPGPAAKTPRFRWILHQPQREAEGLLDLRAPVRVRQESGHLQLTAIAVSATLSNMSPRWRTPVPWSPCSSDACSAYELGSRVSRSGILTFSLSGDDVELTKPAVGLRCDRGPEPALHPEPQHRRKYLRCFDDAGLRAGSPDELPPYSDLISGPCVRQTTSRPRPTRQETQQRHRRPTTNPWPAPKGSSATPE
jgi:hypothetical protein